MFLVSGKLYILHLCNNEGRTVRFLASNLTAADINLFTYRATTSMATAIRLAQTIHDQTALLSSKLDGLRERLTCLEQKGNVAVPIKAPIKKSDYVYPYQPSGRSAERRVGSYSLLLTWSTIQELLGQAEIRTDHLAEADAKLFNNIRDSSPDDYSERQEGQASCDFEQEALIESSELFCRDHRYRDCTKARRIYQVPEINCSNAMETNVIRSLFDTYVKQVHIIHPFLDLQHLQHLAIEMSKQHDGHHTKSKYQTQGLIESGRPNKRRRLGVIRCAIDCLHCEHNALHHNDTIHYAMVYLVLAIGTACTYGIALPRDANKSTMPMQDVRLQSSKLNTRSSNNDVPEEAALTKGDRDSLDRNPHLYGSMQRDNGSSVQCHKPPGYSFYAKAVRLLGQEMDGNKLAHAQAFLLAGLYRSQAGQIGGGMNWISMASRALRTILPSNKLYNLEGLEEHDSTHQDYDVKQKPVTQKFCNLVVLSAWTCLELEGDILAYSTLPASGIQNVQECIPWPRDIADLEAYDALLARGDDQVDPLGSCNILVYYTAHIFLRKAMDAIRREILEDGCLTLSQSQTQAMLMSHEENLRVWRNTLQNPLQWQDDDHATSDLLATRLRAKYWEARHTVNRPFLDYVLHIAPRANEAHDLGRLLGSSINRNRSHAHLFQAIHSMNYSDIWRAARTSVHAIIQGFYAFKVLMTLPSTTMVYEMAHTYVCY